jgi:hypothetical protein
MSMTTGRRGRLLVRHQCDADDRYSSGAVDHLHGHRAGYAQGPGCAGAPAAQGSAEAAAQDDRTIVVQVFYQPALRSDSYKINETDVAKTDLLPELTEIYPTAPSASCSSGATTM